MDNGGKQIALSGVHSSILTFRTVNLIYYSPICYRNVLIPNDGGVPIVLTSIVGFASKCGQHITQFIFEFNPQLVFWRPGLLMGRRNGICANGVLKAHQMRDCCCLYGARFSSAWIFDYALYKQLWLNLRLFALNTKSLSWNGSSCRNSIYFLAIFRDYWAFFIAYLLVSLSLCYW